MRPRVVLWKLLTRPLSPDERQYFASTLKSPLLNAAVLVFCIILAFVLFVYWSTYTTYAAYLARLNELANENPDIPNYLLSSFRPFLILAFALLTTWYLTVGITLILGTIVLFCLLKGLLVLHDRVLRPSELDMEVDLESPTETLSVRLAFALFFAGIIMASSLWALRLVGDETFLLLGVGVLLVPIVAVLKTWPRTIAAYRQRGLTSRQLHKLAMKSSSAALVGAVFVFAMVFLWVPSLRYVIIWEFEALFKPALLSLLNMLEIIVTLSIKDAGLTVPPDTQVDYFRNVRESVTSFGLSGAADSLYGLTADQVVGAIGYAAVTFFALLAVLPHLFIMARRRAALVCVYIVISFVTGQLSFVILPQFFSLPVGGLALALGFLVWFFLSFATSVLREQMRGQQEQDETAGGLSDYDRRKQL